jgi:hypothetical protein
MARKSPRAAKASARERFPIEAGLFPESGLLERFHQLGAGGRLQLCEVDRAVVIRTTRIDDFTLSVFMSDLLPGFAQDARETKQAQR